MRNTGKGIGIILIVLGAVFLINELGVLDQFYALYHVSFGSIVSNGINAMFRLWPLILIAMGITVIFRNRIVSGITWGLFFVLIAVLSVLGPTFYPQLGAPWLIFNNHTEQGTVQIGEDNYTYNSSVDYSPEMKKGQADISLGACKTILSSAGLKAATVESNIKGITSSWTLNSDTLKLNVDEENIIIGAKNLDRTNYINLGDQLIWEINLSTGASDSKLDMRELIVSQISVDMGAGSAELNIGSKSPLTNVNIDGGASDIRIIVPKDSGIDVETDSGLSSNNFDSVNLSPIGEGKYVSDGYSAAANKIKITISTGMSNITLVRE